MGDKMSEPHLYHMILLIYSDKSCRWHWELFPTEQAAEEAAFDVVKRDNKPNISSYSIKPIPVRTT